VDLESELTVVGTDGYDACATLSILSLLDGHQQIWPGAKVGGRMDLSVRMRR
jgi:hypothetical protein